MINGQRKDKESMKRIVAMDKEAVYVGMTTMDQSSTTNAPPRMMAGSSML